MDRYSQVAIVVLLAVLLGTADALRCYKCDTSQDRRCGDPFNKTDFYEQECSTSPNAYTNHNKHYCKKVRENIGGQMSVTRSCVSINEADKGSICGNSHSAQHCSICETDGCNGSPHSMLPSLISCAVPIFLVTLLKN